MTFLKYVAAGIVIIGLIMWIGTALPPLPDSLSTKEIVTEVPEAIVSVPLPEEEDGPVTLEGTVTFGQGQPPVPYIQYATGGGVRTRQLIISGGRGCSPAAGDLPCAGSDTGDYPDLSYGDRIRVTGTVRGDQIFVTSVIEI
jgi:hypothetical protein